MSPQINHPTRRPLTALALLALAAMTMSSLGANVSFAAETKTEAKPVLRHIVIFKFKETTTEAEIKEIVAAFAALKDKIDTITAYEAGTNISPEDKAKGFTHCFVVSFDSAAGRDAYLPHPAHKEFVALLSGKLEDAFVFDFWNK